VGPPTRYAPDVGHYRFHGRCDLADPAFYPIPPDLVTRDSYLSCLEAVYPAGIARTPERGMDGPRLFMPVLVKYVQIEEIERLLGAAAGVTSDASALAAARPRLGAVSFLHRFGSALNHHVHLHVCATEGVFVPAADGAGCDASPAFLPARPITQVHLAALTERVRRRRHAHVGEQRVFSRCQCSDHAHRPRRAELFSELGAPAALLRPATLCARATLCAT
jgi:hypothetical protein